MLQYIFPQARWKNNSKNKSTIKTTPLSDAYCNCCFMSAILENNSNNNQTFIQQSSQPYSTTEQAGNSNKRKPQVPFDLNSIHMNS